MFDKKKRIALMDIGSNTIRLVVFYLDRANNLRELQNIKIPARLAQFLDDNKVMSQEGIDRLCYFLDYFKKEAEIYKVDAILYKATAAIRQAVNQEDILAQVKGRLNIDIDVLPGEMEAYYGYYAVTHTISIPEAVTVDIGGGSAEITHFKDKQLINSYSLPFGVVTLKEKFFENREFNDKKAIKETQKYIKDEIKNLDWLNELNVPVIAIGGSARNIANVHQRLVNFPVAGIHGYEMNQASLSRTLETFKSFDSTASLAELDGQSSERADIIIPANLVFVQLLKTVDSDRFIFSNNGLREGIMMDYYNSIQADLFSRDYVANQTVERFTSLYSGKMANNTQRMYIANQLMEEFSRLNLLNLDQSWYRQVRYGAFMYGLGEFIDKSNISPHTFYIISNSNLPGFSHRDKAIIALIASFKNKSLFHQYSEDLEAWFAPKSLDIIQKLGGLVKFAESLNGTHINIVKSVHLEKENDGSYTLTIDCDGETVIEKYRAERQKKHLKKITNAEVNLKFT